LLKHDFPKELKKTKKCYESSYKLSCKVIWRNKKNARKLFKLFQNFLIRKKEEKRDISLRKKMSIAFWSSFSLFNQVARLYSFIVMVSPSELNKTVWRKKICPHYCPRHTRHFRTQYCDKKIIWAIDFYWPRKAINKLQIKVVYDLLRAYLS